MATRQNQRRKDEERPEGRAIDRLAQQSGKQRGKQFAVDMKARDDAEAAKKAAKPAAQQASADKDGKKKVLAQNDTDATARLPESPRVGDPQRVGGTRVVTQDRNEEKDERLFRRNNAEWDRRYKIQLYDRKAEKWDAENRKNRSSQWRFTTTIGSNGKVKTIGKAWSRSDSSSGGSARNPYAEARDRLLRGDPDESSSVSRSRIEQDWMPKDTSKDAKQRFGASDFFGLDNIRRSSRFAGGYLSDEFRENFINSRMEGLNPGDAGYDAVRRKAEGAWGQAVKQYDRQFMQFGQRKLKEQSRLDFQRRRDALMKQQDEARQSQKKAEATQMEKAGIKGYDRDAKMEGLDLTNRELERAVTEAVRDSYRNTGVAGQVTIGSPVASNVQIGAIAARQPDARGTTMETWASDPSDPRKSAVVSRGTVLRVGDRVGGVEMNTARRDQDATVAQMARTDAAKKGVEKQDAGTFDLMTGMKREESRRSAGGRYAGGGTIVFGDQKTFDAAVAQNQKRMRGVA